MGNNIFTREWWSNKLELKEFLLQESPPIEFEQDDYQDYTLQNRHKIEKAARVFNLPISDMEYAFNAGREVVLSDEMWDNLQNSKSYGMKSLDDAIQHALKLGIEPKPYIEAIKKGNELPLPLVLCYGPNKYYLVGGEIILSLYRALGSIPTVLQGTLNLQVKQLHQPTSLGEGLTENKQHKTKLSPEQLTTLKTFLKYATEELKLEKIPSGLTLSHDNTKAKTGHSFGHFDPTTDKIWLYVGNRNMADILRTLAHELVHLKQHEEGRIKADSGKTGSDIENEANAKAGVLLRDFGKQHEEIYEAKVFFLDIPKFNQPKTFIDKLCESLHEITLSKENAVEINGDLTGGKFQVGNKIYNYNIKNIPNPYKDLGLFYNIQFHPEENITSKPTKDTNPRDYISILSTMYKIIVDFAEKEKPEYIGISSLDNKGDKNYHRIYANLTDNKFNRIPGYFRKDVSLPFDTPGGKGKFIVLKKIEDKQLKEDIFGNYLFGDKETGANPRIGIYDKEMEPDTPAEKELFKILKTYTDSQRDTYSNINLDPYKDTFKILKKEYPKLVDPEISSDTYIYRGTTLPKEKVQELLENYENEEQKDYIIIYDVNYSSRRLVSSWSTSYYTGTHFALTSRDLKPKEIPVVMRTKAANAELVFSQEFIEKISTYYEEEVINLKNNMIVDILIIKDDEYKDEFDNIESEYLHNK